MGKRSVFHITGNRRKGWDIKKAGTKSSLGHYGNKSEAVDRGRRIAKGTKPSQLKIHKENGKIQTEHTYEKDPYPPKG